MTCRAATLPLTSYELDGHLLRSYELSQARNIAAFISGAVQPWQPRTVCLAAVVAMYRHACFSSVIIRLLVVTFGNMLHPG